MVLVSKRDVFITIFLVVLSSSGLLAEEIWIPPRETSWQWQLNGVLNLNYDVDMYDIDLFETEAAVVESLHAQGKRVVCYMSAGSWEEWRPDAALFPPSVIGKPLAGWRGERWLDIRRIDVLGPIMRARLDVCRQKGFDGVEPDNVDAYQNDTGFPLTYQDQLDYNTFLANEAHARGLSIGLKNDLDQIPDLVPFFDWALNEQCFQFHECEKLLPFVAAGKAVFQVEYRLGLKKFCEKAKELGFNSIKKKRSLKTWRKACP